MGQAQTRTAGGDGEEDSLLVEFGVRVVTRKAARVVCQQAGEGMGLQPWQPTLGGGLGYWHQKSRAGLWNLVEVLGRDGCCSEWLILTCPVGLDLGAVGLGSRCTSPHGGSTSCIMCREVPRRIVSDQPVRVS